MQVRKRNSLILPRHSWCSAYVSTYYFFRENIKHATARGSCSRRNEKWKEAQHRSERQHSFDIWRAFPIALVNNVGHFIVRQGYLRHFTPRTSTLGCHQEFLWTLTSDQKYASQKKKFRPTIFIGKQHACRAAAFRAATQDLVIMFSSSFSRTVRPPDLL